MIINTMLRDNQAGGAANAVYLMEKSVPVVSDFSDMQLENYSKDDRMKASLKKGPDAYKQDEIRATLEEIYEKIRDETHMKLVRSVKLASLGQLSAGMAHEINNPLTAVLSYSSLLLDKAQGKKKKNGWILLCMKPSGVVILSQGSLNSPGNQQRFNLHNSPSYRNGE